MGGVVESPYKGSGVLLNFIKRFFEGTGVETISGPGAPTPFEAEPFVSVCLGGALGIVGI